MASLEPEEREAIIGRVELGLSYAELAAAMGRRLLTRPGCQSRVRSLNSRSG
jgi:DNA-directed RNA polymerase specialized sigma24 family protein